MKTTLLGPVAGALLVGRGGCWRGDECLCASLRAISRPRRRKLRRPRPGSSAAIAQLVRACGCQPQGQERMARATSPSVFAALRVAPRSVLSWPCGRVPSALLPGGAQAARAGARREGANQAPRAGSSRRPRWRHLGARCPLSQGREAGASDTLAECPARQAARKTDASGSCDDPGASRAEPILARARAKARAPRGRAPDGPADPGTAPRLAARPEQQANTASRMARRGACANPGCAALAAPCCCACLVPRQRVSAQGRRGCDCRGPLLARAALAHAPERRALLFRSSCSHGVCAKSSQAPAPARPRAAPSLASGPQLDRGEACPEKRGARRARVTLGARHAAAGRQRRSLSPPPALAR